MKSPRDHALALLDKAEHDLVAARATLATGAAMDMVCFHAQQAAEKSLKAVLALKDVTYPWRHDLGELLQLVCTHYPTLNLPAEDLIALSPYAVEARYNDAWTPDPTEARRALQLAEEVHAKLPNPSSPRSLNSTPLPDPPEDRPLPSPHPPLAIPLRLPPRPSNPLTSRPALSVPRRGIPVSSALK